MLGVGLTLGIVCCAAGASGYLDFWPFRTAQPKAPVHVSSPAADTDPRLGTWTSAVPGSKWVRTIRVSSGGVHAFRAAFTVDYTAENGAPVAGVLGDYSANLLMQSDGEAQAIDSEQVCQIQASWQADNQQLVIRQKGHCGEAANLIPDHALTGTYRKAQQDPEPQTPARQDCSQIPAAKVEEKLFCGDPSLRTAREVTAAVYADALVQLRARYAEQAGEFEAANQQWQADVRKVCLNTQTTPEDPDGAKLTCFGQSYDARMNWLRLYTGLLHLSTDPEKGFQRYADALAGYADSYGSQALRLPMFAKRMLPILPAADAAELDSAMTHRGSRGGLYQWGCGPMGCDHQEGAFEIDPKRASVTVAIRNGSKITVFSPDGEAAELPENLHTWLEQRTTRVREIVYKP
ncbi:hypothetical protein F183_A13980 [Bryobacterales bacterium F-183]|nr:hypothetical protein F183_A13980 [Bryobacterales bacterium F-183]